MEFNLTCANISIDKTLTSLVNFPKQYSFTNIVSRDLTKLGRSIHDTFNVTRDLLLSTYHIKSLEDIAKEVHVKELSKIKIFNLTKIAECRPQLYVDLELVSTRNFRAFPKIPYTEQFQVVRNVREVMKKEKV